MATEGSTRGDRGRVVGRVAGVRTTHPPKHVTVDGVGWEYIASGGGEEDLLILPGGAMVAEAGFTRSRPRRTATGSSRRATLPCPLRPSS